MPESELDQGYMRGVHALQRDARGADVPAGFCDQIFQGLQDLFQDGTLDQASLKHGCCGGGLRSSNRKKVKVGAGFSALLREKEAAERSNHDVDDEKTASTVQSLCGTRAVDASSTTTRRFELEARANACFLITLRHCVISERTVHFRQ